PGLRPGRSGGKYIWGPDGIQGQEGSDTVTRKLPSGETVRVKKTFKARNIRGPAASWRGMLGSARGSKNDLLDSTINVNFSDFVFDVKANVVSFEVSVTGNARIIVQGNRFNAQAQAAINKATRGDIIVISNVKTTLEGAPNYKMPDSTPFTWEIQ